MKFKISQVKTWGNDKWKNKLEKLGFKFELEKEFHQGNPDYKWYCSQRIIKKLFEINSLEELTDFINEYGEIIIDKDRITIFNDYL